MEKNDYTNYALHYYKKDLVTTNNGYLNISTIVKDISFPVITGGKEKKIYQSGMIQGWNKFCFTGSNSMLAITNRCLVACCNNACVCLFVRLLYV